jgi:uncharacterized membrane protein
LKVKKQIAETRTYPDRKSGLSVLKSNGHIEGTHRLEMFSDAIFAFAATFLSLEIKIPDQTDIDQSGGILNYFFEIRPAIISYGLSFIFVGIYWANHHWRFTYVRRTDHIYNLLNILLLMTVAFLPFSTAVVGKFITHLEYRNQAVLVYSASYLIPLPALIASHLYATYHNRLVDPHLNRKFINKITIRLMAGFVVISSATAISIFNLWISLGIVLGLLVVFALPPPVPVYDPVKIRKN